MAGVVFVLDFRLGQRGAVVNAPIDRLEAAIDIALLQEVQERAGDGSLVVRVHRQIGIVPAAQYSEALEFDLVDFHIAGGEFAAQAAKLRRRNFRRLAAQFLLDFRLNRESVAVPTWHVRRAEAGHGLRLHDHVLQGLVQSRAKMDFARWIRRAIVQDEQRLAGARFEDAVVKTHLLPGGKLLRLALRELGLHWKVCLGEVERAF